MIKVSKIALGAEEIESWKQRIRRTRMKTRVFTVEELSAMTDEVSLTDPQIFSHIYVFIFV